MRNPFKIKRKPKEPAPPAMTVEEAVAARADYIVALRERQRLTFDEIGRKVGLSASHAGTIYRAVAENPFRHTKRPPLQGGGIVI